MMVCLGIIAISLRSHNVAGPVVERERTGMLIATVKRVETRPGGRFLVIVEDGEFEVRDRITARGLGARLVVRTKLQAGLGAGDRVEVLARLSPPGGPVIPGAFDFSRQSWFRGIGAVGIAMSDIKIISDRTSDRLIANARASVASKAAVAIGGQAGAMAAAFLAGDRGRIKEEIQQAMRDAGLAHLLAISGLHLGLVTGLIFMLMNSILGLFPRLAGRIAVKKPAAIIAWLAALGYLALSGFSLPTQRAFVMVSIGLLAVLLDRRVLSLRSVYLAAFAILIIQPESLVSVGFQMSFAAVTALVAVYERYGHLLKPAGKQRSVTERLVKWLLLSVVTTLVAEIAIAPFALFHFQTVALYGLIANTIAIPLMSFIIMPLGLLMLALMPFGLEHLVAPLIGPPLDMLIWVAVEVSSLPGSTAHPGQIPVSAFLVIIGMALTGLAIRGRLLAPALVAAAIFFIAAWQSAQTPLVLYDASGRLFAVKTVDGLAFNTLRRGKYVRERWLGYHGLAPTEQPGRLSGTCDASGCLWRASNGLTIAEPLTISAMMEDCGRANIILVSSYWSRHCTPSSPSSGEVTSLVIDRDTSFRQGAIAIWASENQRRLATGSATIRSFKDTSWIIKTSRQTSGNRPWVRDYVIHDSDLLED